MLTQNSKLLIVHDEHSQRSCGAAAIAQQLLAVGSHATVVQVVLSFACGAYRHASVVHPQSVAHSLRLSVAVGALVVVDVECRGRSEVAVSHDDAALVVQAERVCASCVVASRLLLAAESLVAHEVDEASAVLRALVYIAEHAGREWVESALQRHVLIHLVVEEEGAALRRILVVGVGARRCQQCAQRNGYCPDCPIHIYINGEVCPFILMVMFARLY